MIVRAAPRRALPIILWDSCTGGARGHTVRDVADGGDNASKRDEPARWPAGYGPEERPASRETEPEWLDRVDPARRPGHRRMSPFRMDGSVAEELPSVCSCGSGTWPCPHAGFPGVVEDPALDDDELQLRDGTGKVVAHGHVGVDGRLLLWTPPRPEGDAPPHTFFDSFLEVREDGDHWRLLRWLVYRGARDTFSVPPGYRTDLGSVPRLLTWLVPKTGVHNRATVLHDWLLATRVVSVRDADGLLREAARVCGASPARVWLLYAGVRAYHLTIDTSHPDRRPSAGELAVGAAALTGLGLAGWLASKLASRPAC